MAEADETEILELDEAQTAHALALDLSVARLTLSPTKVIINWNMAIANTGEEHVVALRVWSDIACASRAAIRQDEAGSPGLDHARLQKIPMLAPGDDARISGEWQMARDAVSHVRFTGDKRVMMIARFRLIGAGIQPIITAFAIGSQQGEDGALPAPLPFDDQMQIFSDLVATQLG